MMSTSNKMNSQEQVRLFLIKAHFKSIEQRTNFSTKENDVDFLKEIEENDRMFELKMKRLGVQSKHTQPQEENISRTRRDEKICQQSCQQPIGTLEYEKTEIEKLKNELEFKNALLVELEAKSHMFEEYQQEVDYLQKAKAKIEIETINYKNTIENLKKENFSLQQKLKRFDEQLNLKDLLSSKDEEILNLKKQLKESEQSTKKAKMDYDLLAKTTNQLKSNNEKLEEKIENLKAEVFILNKEEPKLRGEMRHTFESQSVKNFYPKTKSAQPENELTYFPSEKKLKDSKNEVTFLEEKMSLLFKSKLQIENEMFKMAEKPRTLLEIKHKKASMEKSEEIDKEINEIKTRLRKLKAV